MSVPSISGQLVCPPAPRPNRTRVALTAEQKERALAAHRRYQAAIAAEVASAEKVRVNEAAEGLVSLNVVRVNPN